MAVDLGGTRIKFGLFLNDQLYEERIEFTPCTPSESFSRIKEVYTTWRPEAWGLVVPGRVKSGIWSTSSHPPTDIENCCAVYHMPSPAVLEEDWLATLLGESPKASTYAILQWGTGVGSGYLFKRNLVGSYPNIVGSGIGHISVNPQGPACSCGGCGCIASYASWHQIQILLAEWGYQQLAPAQLLALNDPRVDNRLAQAFKAVAMAAVHLIAGTRAPQVIIGGGNALLFRPQLEEYIKEAVATGLSPNTHTPHTKISWSKLEHRAGLHGAYALYKDKKGYL